MQGEYSTNIQATDTFVKTAYIMARIRATMNQKLNLFTLGKHKETTAASRMQHESTIKRLVEELDSLLDSFADGQARNMKTGELIDANITKGLLNSTETRESCLKKLIDNCITGS